MEGVEWEVRERVGAGGGEMTQTLYAHMNKKNSTNLSIAPVGEAGSLLCPRPVANQACTSEANLED
jgi:hypothetical protein